MGIGLTEVLEGGDIYIYTHMADSHCCTAESKATL